METPAVMRGVYVDCKFMPGLKSARISIDLPIEHSNEFLRMFGAPDRASPVAVAIARLDVAALNAPTVPDKAVEPAKVEKAERGGVDPYQNAKDAGRLIKDAAFQKWIGELCLKKIGKQTVGVDPMLAADSNLKDVLAITSKRELNEGPRADAWNRLYTDFRYRGMTR